MSIKILKRKKNKKRQPTHTVKEIEKVMAQTQSTRHWKMEMTSYVKQLGKQKQMPK
jgi:hypothetical protein